MKLVIDANVLFSALIKNSLTAELIFKEGLKLNAPCFFIEEFMKYEDLILKKTKRTKEQFIQIMHMLKNKIAVFPEVEFSELLDEAKDLSPDEKDITYFALALKLNCPIWSNDKRLKEQNKIVIYNTGELLKLI